MSAPYGPPPGAGPQGPPPGWAPPAPRASLGLDKILAFVVLGLGVIALFMGFLDASSAAKSFSFFASGGAYFAAGYLIAGLLALGAVLPKVADQSFPSAVISVATTLVLLFTLFGVTGPGPGFIITLILGFLQMIAAVVAFLIGSGILKLAPKPPVGYPGYGPGYGAPGGYPQGYGQQQGPPAQQAPQGYPQQQPQQPPGYPQQ